MDNYRISRKNDPDELLRRGLVTVEQYWLMVREDALVTAPPRFSPEAVQSMVVPVLSLVPVAEGAN